MIADLRERLARTRWPDAETVEDWSQGLPLGQARELSRDHLLDNVMVYWLNATAGSSARLYWESFGTAFAGVEEIATPTAYIAYPREIIRLSERLARTRFTDLRHYARPERGGHFAALEVPETFLAEVRAGVRALDLRD